MMKNKRALVSFYLHAALRKIRCQFPDTAESRLMFAIVSQAVMDLDFSPYRCGAKNKFQVEQNRLSAIRFLNGEIFPAQIVGVSPQWIREVFYKTGEHYQAQLEAGVV